MKTLYKLEPIKDAPGVHSIKLLKHCNFVEFIDDFTKDHQCDKINIYYRTHLIGSKTIKISTDPQNYKDYISDISQTLIPKDIEFSEARSRDLNIHLYRYQKCGKLKSNYEIDKDIKLSYVSDSEIDVYTHRYDIRCVNPVTLNDLIHYLYLNEAKINFEIVIKSRLHNAEKLIINDLVESLESINKFTLNSIVKSLCKIDTYGSLTYYVSV